MTSGVRLATIRGIPVRADASVLVIVGVLAWGLADGALPEGAPGYSGFLYGVAAVATAVVVMGSLLAHEFGHALVARRAGIGVRDITLWMLGGVSRIEREAADPATDLRVAIVGPAVSFAVAAGAMVVAFASARIGGPPLLGAGAAAVASVNLVLAGFNLVPAAPLDGGRVLRAFLWRRHGDRCAAALTAARAGRAFAFGLGGLGLLAVAGGAAVSGIWMVLLGWFLLDAARAEEAQVVAGRDLLGVRVGRLMTPDPWTLAAALPVGSALDDEVPRRGCSAFPVTDADGSVRGLVGLRALRAVPLSRRTTTPVAAVMTPVAAVTCAEPDEFVLDVLRRADPTADPRVLVLRGGRLVGLLAPSDVTRAVRTAEAARHA